MTRDAIIAELRLLGGMGEKVTPERYDDRTLRCLLIHQRGHHLTDLLMRGAMSRPAYDHAMVKAGEI